MMLSWPQSIAGAQSAFLVSPYSRLLQRVDLSCKLQDQAPAEAGRQQPRPGKMHVPLSNLYYPPLGWSRSGGSLSCVTPVLAAGSEMP